MLQGLTSEQVAFISTTMKRFLPEAKILAFGSRVQGSARQYSDLDLALELEGKKPVPLHVLSQIQEVFQQSNLPIRIDIIDMATISDDFRAIILKKHLTL